ncbi:L,D-transpeptidase family protein [Vreelandella arcis]|uniref:L,D-transpeptidase catalytic domain n=1 Tax=Vreelandella arcis TaxID=416873 RepID=A0A1H0EZ84_9GAMM|nr:L,D-transpeptidase [Halomonas arcis]SDN87690.1 L,D-transpeptidase catalytic domain [Halomonas arcis]
MKLVTRRRFLAIALSWPVAASAAASTTLASEAYPDLVAKTLERAAEPREPNELWVLIDDEAATLSVYRGYRVIEAFKPVSLGRGGASTQRLRGGNATPMGEFRINRFNYDSKWHTFMGVNYPTPTHARMALQNGVYSQHDYDAYFDYYRRHREPPQQTVLGGAIGIHGLGEADPDIHGRYHWTQGCVAVTNSQIERLTELVEVGTRVVIR